MKKQKKQSLNQKKVILRILKYIRPYRLLVLISVLLAGISVALTLSIPIITGKCVDLIVAPGNVDFAGLRDYLLVMAVVIALNALLQWIMNTVNNRITFQVVMDIRTKAYDHLNVLPLRYMDSHPHGDIISRVITDIDTFSDGLLMGFTQLFTSVITILGTLGFMCMVNYKITLVVVCLTPLSLVTAEKIAKKTFVMFKKQSESRAEMTSLVDEMLSNQKTVKAFGQEEENVKTFSGLNETFYKYSLKATFYSSITNPATRFINAMVYAGVGVFGSIAAVQGMLSVGQLTCFLSYANQYTKPFNEISGVLTELQNAIACAYRVFLLIDEPAETTEKAMEMHAAKGEVKISNVDFSYTENKPLIEKFNLSVKPGQRIAIVGPTGCGKSTLINLLMRFYDVQNGSIQIDGTDIRDVTRKSLREQYGMVLQETWLKKGTIAQNIAYGCPDATREDIISAAKEAFAHNFIRRMKDGYDTIIEEDGGSLSQGQKQLLCIARVMLCKPPMLILDEATSSIDSRTEICVQEAFAKMMKGRTSFIVAHRLSTIKEADVILVMEKGHIIEQGTHEELLAANGFYTNLYNSQFATN